MKPMFGGGWASLFKFQALVSVAVYLLPLLFLSGEGSFFGMGPSNRVFWLLLGWGYAGAAATLASLAVSAFGRFPALTRSRALLGSLLPLVLIVLNAGAVEL